MTGGDMLQVRIARLAEVCSESAPVSELGRELVASGEAALASILRTEIAETRLPRVLRFQNPRGQILAIEVRSGRVMGLCRRTTGLSSAKVDWLAQCQLDGKDHTARHALRCLIAELVAETKALRVRSDPLTTPIAAGIMGIAAENLAPAPQPDAAAVARAFLASARPLLDAAVLMQGDEVIYHFGKGESVDILKGDWLQSVPLGHGHGLILHSAGATEPDAARDVTYLLARVQAVRLSTQLSTEAVEDAMKLWRAACCGL